MLFACAEVASVPSLCFAADSECFGFFSFTGTRGLGMDARTDEAEVRIKDGHDSNA